MVTPELQQALREPTPLHEMLRAIAGTGESTSRLGKSEAAILRRAAAEIDGHNHAFTQVVADKHAALAEQKRFEKLLHDSYDFIARWRELLVALQVEHPEDIRLKRALMGEHPMRPAPWEKQP